MDAWMVGWSFHGLPVSLFEAICLNSLTSSSQKRQSSLFALWVCPPSGLWTNFTQVAALQFQTFDKRNWLFMTTFLLESLQLQFGRYSMTMLRRFLFQHGIGILYDSVECVVLCQCVNVEHSL